MTKIILSDQTKSRVRLALFSYFFGVGLCFASWASRIPDIKMVLGLDDGEWGTMLLMIPIGQVIGMTFSGRLISRVGSHKVLVVAAIGYALALTAIGLIPSKPLFISSLIVFGFFGNFCNISMNSQAFLVAGAYSKPIMASFHGGWSLAGLVGGLLGLAMTLINMPVHLHFLLVSIVVILNSVMQARFMQYDAVVKSVDGETSKAKAKPELFLVWFGIIGFVGWIAEGTMTDWNGIFLRDIIGVSERVTPLGLTVYMVTMTAGRFVMDRATAKWGRQKLLAFCSAAIACGVSLFIFVPTMVATLIGFMIVGLGTCGIIPLVYSASGEKTAMHPSRAITIVSTISFVGFLIGPPIIGYISQMSNLRYAFGLVAIFGVLSWALSSRLKSLN